MLFGRAFQDLHPVTVKEQLLYFKVRMMRDLPTVEVRPIKGAFPLGHVVRPDPMAR